MVMDAGRRRWRATLARVRTQSVLGLAAAVFAVVTILGLFAALAPAAHAHRGARTTAAGPTDVTPPTTLASGAPAGWTSRRVTVTLTAGDDPGGSGVASLTYAIDGGAPVTVPEASTAVVFAAPADHAGDGRHALSFYATDLAGNIEPPQSLSVRISTRPPRLHWRSLVPALLRRAAPLTLHFVVNDPTGRVTAAARLYDGAGVLVSRGRAEALASGAARLAVSPRYAGGGALLPGLYTVRLALTDEAGNKALSGPIVFRDQRPVHAAVWHSVPGAGRRVALTFDDGYDEAAWSAIVATLHAHGAHASFFINGRYVVAFPALARRTVAWGNAIGSHTWSHILSTTATPAELSSQIEGDVRAWWRVARTTPVPYFRPPYGGKDATTVAVAGSLGFARVMLWSVDPSDYTDPGAAVIVARVLAAVRPGAVVELHLKPQTAAALPGLIGALRARGYALVTLPALFRAGGYR
jgi:peptidoglycan-N-acetylglucosamine deacetylase